MVKRPPPEDYFICPNCGEQVRRGAKSCRHCGADDESGWSDEALDYGDDSAYDEFDYDEFVADEFPAAASGRPLAWKKIGFALVALLLIYVLLRQMGLL